MGEPPTPGIDMETFRIPIQNLYYLLCYSWNYLKQGELIDISRLSGATPVDLFAKVLCDGIEHLARRGLEKGYEPHEDEIAGIRGRINVLASCRKFLPLHGRAVCQFDELTSNTLSNQILKSTLRLLAQDPALDKELQKRVQIIDQRLEGISRVQLSSQCFRRVQLHSNNRFYRFLLSVCEFILRASLIDQRSGKYKFRDFVRDERLMALVFQNFLFNFLRLELPDAKVKREQIGWRASSETDVELKLLPRMETDISLRRGSQYTVIDAKYYQNTLNQHHGVDKLHSGNLYQLMGYLSNLPPDSSPKPSGMLIYPQVEKRLRHKYLIQGFEVMTCTINLNQDWGDLKQEILSLFH